MVISLLYFKDIPIIEIEQCNKSFRENNKILVKRFLKIICKIKKLVSPSGRNPTGKSKFL